MDDTIENFCEALVYELNRRNGTNVAPEEIDCWDLTSKFPGLTEDEVFAPAFYEDFWETVKPIDGAVEGVKKLMDDGHEVYIVTASHPETIALKTRCVLKRYFPFVKTRQIVVTSNKSIIRGDILIDDAAQNFEGWPNLGIILDAPHNRSFDEAAHGIVRAKDWKEIYKDVCLFTDILNR